MIDLQVRCGKWYNVTVRTGQVDLEENKAIAGQKAPLRVFAFDIECTKKPLKFPDAKSDEARVISTLATYHPTLISSHTHLISSHLRLTPSHLNTFSHLFFLRS